MQAYSTVGLARRAARISFADLESAKLSAAMLFDPIIVAEALRSCVFARRKVDRSNNVNTTDATTRATAEVTMTIICSLCRIDKSTYERISAPFRMLLVMHDLSQCEKRETELQAGSSRGVGIDRKSQTVVLESELNRPALRCEAISLTDRQYFAPCRLSRISARCALSEGLLPIGNNSV